MPRAAETAYTPSGKPLNQVATKKWVDFNAPFLSDSGGSISGNLHIGGNLSVTGTSTLDGTTATTPATADNSTSVATTAFVKAQGYGPGTITGLTAGIGLTGGGTSGTVTVNLGTPVSVANGGTGTSTAGSLPATATNNNATAGTLGEYVSANVTVGVPLTTGVAANVASLSLTAGDWDVGGNVTYQPSAAILGYTVAGISTVSATLPAANLACYTGANGGAGYGMGGIAPCVRVSIALTTTVYLVCETQFGTGTCPATGLLWARRAR